MTSFPAEQAAEFVRRFEPYWEAPTAEGLATVLADNVRLEAPTMPTTNTLEDAKRVWAGMLELIPDLTATVHRWGATDDGVMIEFTLTGTVPTGSISWHPVQHDRKAQAPPRQASTGVPCALA
jgi:hypothetical protein